LVLILQSLLKKNHLIGGVFYWRRHSEYSQNKINAKPKLFIFCHAIKTSLLGSLAVPSELARLLFFTMLILNVAILFHFFTFWLNSALTRATK